jgi:hypothetical protein
VTWINSNLDWTATDYQKRTAEEIIHRHGGNCHELASVLERLLQASKIRHRWIAEINLQPESIERQKSAEQLMMKSATLARPFGCATTIIAGWKFTMTPEIDGFLLILPPASLERTTG